MKLRPRLEALLTAYKDQKKQQAQDRRLRERHELLINRLSDLKRFSPLLVETTIKGLRETYSNTTYRLNDYEWDEDGIFRVRAPFPTPSSAMGLPIIRSLVDKDISGGNMGQNFDKLSDLVIQDIAAWRTQVERDLAKIWRTGNEPPPVRSLELPAIVGQTSQRHGPNSNTPARPKDLAKSAKRALLPEVRPKFTRSDGKTTRNIQELPDDLRLLLRADVVFRAQGTNLPTRHCSYPEIVSGPSTTRRSRTSRGELLLGDLWDPTAIARDEDGSRVAAIPRGTSTAECYIRRDESLWSNI